LERRALEREAESYVSGHQTKQASMQVPRFGTQSKQSSKQPKQQTKGFYFRIIIKQFLNFSHKKITLKNFRKSVKQPLQLLPAHTAKIMT